MDISVDGEFLYLLVIFGLGFFELYLKYLMVLVVKYKL